MKQILRVVKMELRPAPIPEVALYFVRFHPETEQVDESSEKMMRGLENMPGLTDESKEGMKDFFQGLSGLTNRIPIGLNSGSGYIDDGRFIFREKDVKDAGITVGSFITIDVNAISEEQATRGAREP